MEFRYSTQQDYDIIRELIELRFGNRDTYGLFDDLDGRYFLAFDGDLLVGMTGLRDIGFYKGTEIDWTCLRKEYEGQGIITNMISRVIEGVERDIYCSCWKLGGSDAVNLQHAMDSLGFEVAIPCYKNFDSKYIKCKDICVNASDDCYCYEVLYVKKYGEGAL